MKESHSTIRIQFAFSQWKMKVRLTKLLVKYNFTIIGLLIYFLLINILVKYNFANIFAIFATCIKITVHYIYKKVGRHNNFERE